MGVAPERPSLLSAAKQYIKWKYDKPGNVYLGVVSRLDAPVTGVVLFARTSKAAARLNEQFRARTVEKIYWAVVQQAPDPRSGQCLDWLLPDQRHRRVDIAAPATPNAREARLHYRTIKQSRGAVLLEVQLETGRKHQIRIQLSSRGWPIFGDRKYGASRTFSAGIALHARTLEVLHPVTKAPLRLSAPLPRSWREFGNLVPVE